MSKDKRHTARNTSASAPGKVSAQGLLRLMPFGVPGQRLPPEFLSESEVSGGSRRQLLARTLQAWRMLAYSDIPVLACELASGIDSEGKGIVDSVERQWRRWESGQRLMSSSALQIERAFGIPSHIFEYDRPPRWLMQCYLRRVMDLAKDPCASERDMAWLPSILLDLSDIAKGLVDFAGPGKLSVLESGQMSLPSGRIRDGQEWTPHWVADVSDKCLLWITQSWARLSQTLEGIEDPHLRPATQFTGRKVYVYPGTYELFISEYYASCPKQAGAQLTIPDYEAIFRYSLQLAFCLNTYAKAISQGLDSKARLLFEKTWACLTPAHETLPARPAVLTMRHHRNIETISAVSASPRSPFQEQLIGHAARHMQKEHVVLNARVEEILGLLGIGTTVSEISAALGALSA